MMKYICFFIISVIIYCPAQTKERLRAVELNDRAVELYNKFYDDTSSVQYILQLYDEAIETDSLYVMAYLNKSNLLREIGRCEEALQTLDKLVSVRSDLVGYWSMGGFILEAMGHRKEAEKRYIEDILVLDSMILTTLDSSLVYFEVQRAFLLMLVEGEKKGIEELEKLRIEYPNDQYVTNQELLFETFDREKFISDYCR